MLPQEIISALTITFLFFYGLLSSFYSTSLLLLVGWIQSSRILVEFYNANIAAPLKLHINANFYDSKSVSNTSSCCSLHRHLPLSPTKLVQILFKKLMKCILQYKVLASLKSLIESWPLDLKDATNLHSLTSPDFVYCVSITSAFIIYFLIPIKNRWRLKPSRHYTH